MNHHQSNDKNPSVLHTVYIICSMAAATGLSAAALASAVLSKDSGINYPSSSQTVAAAARTLRP